MIDPLNSASERADEVPVTLTAENLRLWVIAYLAYLLNRPAGQIDLWCGLSEYGLDSMDAVVMAGAMEEHFQIEIDPLTFIRESTIGVLLEELGRPTEEP